MDQFPSPAGRFTMVGMLNRRWRILWLLLLASVFAGGYLMLQPRWIVRRLNGHTPGVLYAWPTDSRAIALTIDDGPDPKTTPRMLEVLDQYEAHATFFVLTDHIPGREPLVEQMLSEGHELGNHMLSDRASIRLSAPDFEQHLLRARQILEDYAPTRWFRPGSGWYNREMLAVLHRYGYETVLGSIYPYDAHLPSSWLASRYILWRAHPGGVIILHDSGARGMRTVETLKVILPALQARGYRIMNLTELSEFAEPDGSL